MIRLTAHLQRYRSAWVLPSSPARSPHCRRIFWRNFRVLAKIDELKTTPTALHLKAQRRERSERTLGYAMNDKRP